tara:strand:- start:8971 stop:9567 length:597 start_codon:yes stop_codon:yes gene_type:complete
MSVAIETKEAVAALQVAAKECGDVLAAAENELDDSTEGRGYAFIASRLDDAMRVINNVLRDIGEAPSLPPARAPKEVRVTEKVVEYVDKPETLERMEKLEAELERQIKGPHASEAMLAELEAVADKLETASEETETPFDFSVSFLNDEFDAESEHDLHGTNARLLAEYEELQQGKRGLDDASEARLALLHSKYYTFKG